MESDIKMVESVHSNVGEDDGKDPGVTADYLDDKKGDKEMEVKNANLNDRTVGSRDPVLVVKVDIHGEDQNPIDGVAKGQIG